MHGSLLATLVLTAMTVLAACGDDDGGAPEQSGDPATAAYCDLVEESVEVQNEVGPDGPTPEQRSQMLDVAMRLKDDVPEDLQPAYDAVEKMPADASGPERIEVMRAFSEAVDEWTSANCV